MTAFDFTAGKNIPIEVGRVYKMRDGRNIQVTDLASQDVLDYTWYAEDGKTINDSLPVESIVVGTRVDVYGYGLPHLVPRGTVVTDVSEIDYLIC